METNSRQRATIPIVTASSPEPSWSGWDGKPQRITVLDQGFAWNGTTYRSLTQIAFAMTGTLWSGPRFFGLRRENDQK